MSERFDYVFFDTETTGVPRNYRAPITDTRNWPRIVQISWICVDSSRNIIRKEDHIIKPVGFVIPDDAAAIHGITQSIALQKGEDLEEVITKFNADVEAAEYVVGHNVSFDINVEGCECVRLGLDTPFEDKTIQCTMSASTDYCKIPGRYGYKWPKLDELYYKLFRRHFDDAHNSMADITATFECYWKLRDLGVMK